MSIRVQSLSCPHCGGRTRLEHGLLEALCIHCGNTVTRAEAAMQEQAAAARFPNRSPIQLGMKGTWHGREYEVTGRQVFQQWDEGTLYQWDEWVLVAPDGHLMYLELDEGKWKLSWPYVPVHPLGPAELAACASGGYIPVEGDSLIVQDHGVAALAHAEGEFPYLVTLGAQRSFLDASSGPRFISVEWTEDAVEWYQGHPIADRELFTLFALRDEIRRLDLQELARRSRFRFGLACLAASFLGIVLWIGASIAGSQVVPGGQGTVQLGGVSATEGRRFGPFRLSAVGRVHRLEISGTMRESSSWVQAVLEDENETELLDTQKDMWDESGWEEGEYWHESDLRASSDFVLAKAGNYYVRLYMEPDKVGATSGSATASFRLRERVVYPTWILMFILLTGIGGILFVIAGSPGARARVAQSFQSSE